MSSNSSCPPPLWPGSICSFGGSCVNDVCFCRPGFNKDNIFQFQVEPVCSLHIKTLKLIFFLLLLSSSINLGQNVLATAKVSIRKFFYPKQVFTVVRNVAWICCSVMVLVNDSALGKDVSFTMLFYLGGLLIALSLGIHQQLYIKTLRKSKVLIQKTEREKRFEVKENMMTTFIYSIGYICPPVILCFSNEPFAIRMSLLFPLLNDLVVLYSVYYIYSPLESLFNNALQNIKATACDTVSVGTASETSSTRETEKKQTKRFKLQLMSTKQAIEKQIKGLKLQRMLLTRFAGISASTTILTLIWPYVYSLSVYIIPLRFLYMSFSEIVFASIEMKRKKRQMERLASRKDRSGATSGKQSDSSKSKHRSNFKVSPISKNLSTNDTPS